MAEPTSSRRHINRLAAPNQPAEGYFSRFGGLWTDRRDAAAELDRRVRAGTVPAEDQDGLRHWIEHGWVVLPGAVPPEVCDEVRSAIDGALSEGDERLLMHSPASEDYQPVKGGVDTERARIVDAYVHLEPARRALFAEPIVHFLETVFDDAPLLFQSLSFQKGSQQQVHQDTAFVVVESPLEFAASWIALEDIQPGSGELMYFDGSHRLPEYLFSGRFKHWNAGRDGEQQHDEWHQGLYRNAEQLGLEEQRFLPRKGDVLIWSADLAHGGSEVGDPGLTRKSLVGHYCPAGVRPFYFSLRPARRTVGEHGRARYASSHYAIDR